ncbi:carbamoyltransferase C-terminal domain-containing protein [Kordia aestuariivivens]|uniref:carbamoyltransferase C-terminal domain-containing protein n=1 Tax=Kordia aestuariivivens TaxID=2759037 RepID=UPI001F217F4B|nr:carbamoyltransferase C-terminal domain-containing protein [Kordia aestuariivivens]
MPPQLFYFKYENKEVYELLKCYKEISGIPLLCNTSANFRGRGFFSNLKSAIKWGKVNYIWSEGILYTKYKLSNSTL